MNLSIQKGIYALKLKHAKIVPVYKDGDELDPANYRPISLLSNIKRIFEKLVNNRINNFINKHKILCPSQYGFRKHCSTEHALLDIVGKIQKYMDEKLFRGNFIDLRKAFDTVDHNILLYKLHHYGIRGVINKWFCSYLTGRFQTTQIETEISEKEAVACGVP